MSARHQIAIGPIPTAEERAAIHRRLRGPAKVINIHQAPKQPVEPPQGPHDAHVVAYREFLDKREKCVTPGSYVRFLCEAYSVSSEMITKRTTNKVIIAAKHRIIFELRQKFPHLTMASIGRHVGNIDHTSVHHALCKFGYQSGDRGRLKPEQIERIMALYAEGTPIYHIAKEIGCGPNTVRAKVEPAFRQKQLDWNARGRQARKGRK